MLTRALIGMLMVAGLVVTLSSSILLGEEVEMFETAAPVAAPKEPEYEQKMVIPVGSTPEDLAKGQKILEAYQKVLQRMPSPTEYRAAALGSLAGLEEKLYNSPEFARMVKVQSNQTFPELTKVMYDLRLIHKIITLYRTQLKKDPYPTLRLPLKDAYIFLDSSDAAFIEMLKSPRYPEWEAQMLHRPMVGRIDVEASVEEYFARDTLMRLAAASIAAAAAASGAASAASKKKAEAEAKAGAEDINQLVLQKPNVFIIATGGSSVSSVQDIEKLLAAANGSKTRKVDEKDTDMKCMVDSIQKQDFRKRLYFDKGDLVLRPEYEWKMPERAPPVCTNPPGMKPVDVAPVLEGSKLLLGTPLEESKETGVGSIMPKFEFREYVEV